MNNHKLQLALDRMTIEDCMRLIEETGYYVDWVEIGTGVIKEYGMTVIRDIRDRFPDKVIVADMKTCDAGKHESIQAFKSGANITTVMGFAQDATITQCLEVASKHNGEVMIDLLGVENAQRVKEIYSLGARLFCLHIGKDSQHEGEFATSGLFSLVEGLNDIRVAVAGGVNDTTLHGLLKTGANIIIVGNFITGSTSPKENAIKISGVLKSYVSGTSKKN